ncbi:MAG TPA: hypothetical protein VI172_04995 [Candidatus Dormibacteraeota bacterium]|jgi:hypothetical protein
MAADDSETLATFWGGADEHRGDGVGRWAPLLLALESMCRRWAIEAK